MSLYRSALLLCLMGVLSSTGGCLAISRFVLSDRMTRLDCTNALARAGDSDPFTGPAAFIAKCGRRGYLKPVLVARYFLANLDQDCAASWALRARKGDAKAAEELLQQATAKGGQAGRCPPLYASRR